jgi:hypothetical protein
MRATLRVPKTRSPLDLCIVARRRLLQMLEGSEDALDPQLVAHLRRALREAEATRRRRLSARLSC